MSWDNTLMRMLPPIGGVPPHITGPTGRFGAGEAAGRKPPSSIPHKGVDANYFGGQNALNKSHPILHAPVDAEVVLSGGRSGTISIKDSNGFVHKLMHTSTRNVGVGDRVSAGERSAQWVIPEPTIFIFIISWKTAKAGKSIRSSSGINKVLRRRPLNFSVNPSTSRKSCLAAFQLLLPALLRLIRRRSPSSARSANPAALAKIHSPIASANGVLYRYLMRPLLPTIPRIFPIVLAGGT